MRVNPFQQFDENSARTVLEIMLTEQTDRNTNSKYFTHLLTLLTSCRPALIFTVRAYAFFMWKNDTVKQRN